MPPPESNKPLCSVPWHSIFVGPEGQIRPCCISKDDLGSTLNGETVEQAWHSSKMQEIRSELLGGKMPAGCWSCAAKEKFGGRSLRTSFEKQIAHERPVPFDYKAIPALDLLRLDFTFSNVCNLRCRFCGPWNSTKWAADARRLAEAGFDDYDMVVPHIHRKAEELIDLVDRSARLSTIELRGGEPFMSNELLKALEMLVSSGQSRRLTLMFSTNGTIVQERVAELFPYFDRVNLYVSVEATGSLYGYLRGEENDLEKVGQSIRFYDSIPKVSGAVHMALSAYSLFEPVKVQSWLTQLGTKNYSHLNIAPVVAPEHLNPAVLPREARLRAAEIMSKAEAPRLREAAISLSAEAALDRAPDRQRELFERLKGFTRKLDEVRETRLSSVAPEIAAYLFVES